MREVIAEWRWFGARETWVGPGGAPDQPFVRLPPIGSDHLLEFAAGRNKNPD
ncbi:MAG: hypothetical protein KAI24_02510 [Planctomycetes bacterium]|nr:hypothetical protein [Planctomycetota bacterium]